jgi:hypothetical protein
MIEISLPRIRRISAWLTCSRSRSLNSSLSAERAAEAGRRLRRPNPRVVLPEPDSPQMPTISPALTRKVASDTARHLEALLSRYSTVSPRTSSSGALSVSGDTSAAIRCGKFQQRWFTTPIYLQRFTELEVPGPVWRPGPRALNPKAALLHLTLQHLRYTMRGPNASAQDGPPTPRRVWELMREV